MMKLKKMHTSPCCRSTRIVVVVRKDAEQYKRENISLDDDCKDAYVAGSVARRAVPWNCHCPGVKYGHAVRRRQP